MTKTDVRDQAVIDQAREQVADMIAALQKNEPDFLKAVYKMIDIEQTLAGMDTPQHVLMPILTFRVTAQLAKIGVADILGLLKRRGEET